MGDVLSQNEIDNLLAALSTGELDVDEIKDNNEKKVKSTILPVLPNFPRNICVPWK